MAKSAKVVAFLDVLFILSRKIMLEIHSVQRHRIWSKEIKNRSCFFSATIKKQRSV